MRGGKRKGAWAAPTPAAPAVPESSLLRAVRAAEAAPSVEALGLVLDELDRWELDLVDALRSGGVSWRQLGHAYGVTTPQGARLRVLRLRERLGRPERL